ncbi:MAG TPA: peptide ABC transporter substrate-binding protein [Chloroflexota bacterium]
MNSSVPVAWALASAMLLLIACGGGSTSAVRSAEALPEEARVPRGTVTIAWSTEPENLHSKLAAGSSLNEFFWVFNSFLSYFDMQGALHAMLAAGLPTQENGDWTVNPDGTMVTTYRLRENARWQDGTPLTAEDFRFGFEVYMDPEVPIRDRTPESLMSSVEAPDARSIAIHWNQPYVGANTLTFQQLPPLPRHLAEQPYRTNKANFVSGDLWTSSYVGTGPFRVEQWEPGVRLVARANRDWVLGAPKIETVVIRFISDTRAELTALLAGEVDLINSPGVRTTEAAVARDQWATRNEGYIGGWTRTIRFLSFQFRDVPNWQRAVTNLRVRQAVMHATDRQSISDVVNSGFGKVADAFINPSDPWAPDVDRVITKYPYDPTRASALLAEAGWSRSDAGGPVRNGAGETLDIEVWTTPEGDGEREAAIMADSWKRVGINSSIYFIPPPRQRDLEYRVSFPAVNLTSRSATLDNFVFTSLFLPTREGGWQGSNRGSFQDSEVDRLHNLALTTVDARQRRDYVIALQKRMSETVGVGMMYWAEAVYLVRNRLKGPVGEVAEKSGMSWNIFEWEVE